MPLPTETGSKKHIVAEGYFETEISPALSKLFITDFPDFRVLSLYSELSNQFLAYKIVHRLAGNGDAWLHAEYALTRSVDFNPEFELLPPAFADNAAKDPYPFVILPESPAGSLHFAYGLARYHALRPENQTLYLFRSAAQYSIFVFSGKDCRFANSFECHSETEVLYFIVSAMAVCDMEPQNTAVLIDYNIAGDQKLRNYLKPYLRPLQTMKPAMENPDAEIPLLPELLFPNYLLSLCV